MSDTLSPKSVMCDAEDLYVKRLLYGDYCKGCKHFLRKLEDYPCKFCKFIPSHYDRCVKLKIMDE